MPIISVVSPVFNESDCLPELLTQLHAVLSTISSDYEILLVDDGSDDESWEIIELSNNHDSRVKGLRFSRNFGHHVAIAAGLDHAEGDWVVIMDSDLQDLPSAIIDLYSKALSGYDIVIAHRQSKAHSLMKRLLSSAFHATLSYLMGARSDPKEGVFRIIRRKAVLAMRLTKEQSRFFPALAAWVGFRKCTIDVKHGARHAGRTKYPLNRQISLAASAILSFSDKPLKLAVALGMLFSISGMIYAFIIIWRALVGDIAVQGYASLFIAIMVVGGFCIMTTGLVGLYVGRIFQQVKQRPLYILSDTTEHSSPQ